MSNSYQIAAYYGLRSADLIKSPKSLFDLIQHYALFWGYDANGDAWVVENLVGQGVVYTRMDDFLTRVGKVTAIIKYQGNDWSRQQVMRRASARVGWKYDAFSYNCEHFVNDALRAAQESRQADTAKGILAGLAALVVIAAVARK